MALGVPPEEVWDAPERFAGLPFVELIDFPDGVDGIFGPQTSAKLHRDFVAFSVKARRHLNRKGRVEWLVPPPPATRAAAARRSFNQMGATWARVVVRKLGFQPRRPMSYRIRTNTVDIRWMYALYRRFRRAFRLASDGGLVRFE